MWCLCPHLSWSISTLEDVVVSIKPICRTLKKTKHYYSVLQIKRQTEELQDVDDNLERMKGIRKEKTNFDWNEVTNVRQVSEVYICLQLILYRPLRSEKTCTEDESESIWTRRRHFSFVTKNKILTEDSDWLFTDHNTGSKKTCVEIARASKAWAIQNSIQPHCWCSLYEIQRD